MRTAVLVAVLVASAQVSRAQTPDDTAAFQVERFEPGAFIGTDILNVTTTRLTPHLVPSVGLMFHYVDNPLVLRSITRTGGSDEISDTIEARLIDAQLKAELLVGLALWDRIALGVAMPVALWSDGDDLALAGRPGEHISGFAPGDLRLVPKFVILAPGRDGGFGLDVHVPIYLPTGDANQFMGDDSVRARPSLGVDWTNGDGFVIAVNLGFLLRPERVAHDYVSDDDFTWGLGVQVPLVSDLELIGSLFGSVQTRDERDPFALEEGVVSESDDARGSPIEVDAGLRYRFDAAWTLSAAAGTGITGDVGSPRFRAVVGIGFTPTERDSDGDGIEDGDDTCPSVAEDKDGFEDGDGCPDLDDDKDGIIDGADQCPREPEDIDGYVDADGCPDPDNDGDGVPDTRDQCMNISEDQDNFQDEDGCPELDDDGDGILDALDACRTEAEDKDGFDDDDGCPDPDNDKDGVLDAADKCPNQPETKNGVDDEDGCPDTTSKNIRIAVDQIVILQKVFFAYDRDVIKPESYGILNEVAQTLRENPWISKIRVDGHTDNEGPDAYNLDLSTRRAASVMRFLEKAGIVATRLDSRGFGETTPIASNKSAKGRAENRRVEFRILEINGRAVVPAGTPDAAPTNIKIESIDNKPTGTE